MAYRPGTPGASGGKNYLVGFKEVMANLNIEIGMIQGRGMKGLIQGAREIKNETLQGAVKTPKEVGNLRESWFVVTKNGVINGRSPSFKTNPNKPKLTASVLQASHAQAISESQGILSAISTKYNPVLMLGYSAPYAGFVHEFIGDINWTYPGSGAKWLQSAVNIKKDTILKIIANNARIKR